MIPEPETLIIPFNVQSNIAKRDSAKSPLPSNTTFTGIMTKVEAKKEK